jgi:WD40 repeat protein
VPTKRPIDSVGFTTSGRMLTLSGGRIGLWDSQGHAVGGRGAQPSPPGDVHAAAITPDGRRWAAGLADGVEVYDAGGRTWRSVSQPPRDVSQLAFDRAGTRLLAVGDDRTVRVWDVVHLSRRPQILRHASPVLDAGFSPREGLVLTAGADGTARLWDPSLEAALLELRTSPHGGARFSNDGRLMALGGPDAVGVRTCEICAPFDQLVGMARARLTGA